MSSVFFDLVVESPDDGHTVLMLKCDHSRFPSEEAIDRLLLGLRQARKLRDLPRHALTGQRIPIEEQVTMCIWKDVYVIKLPWLGVTSLASDVSKAELYQYVTVAGANKDTFTYETYERAVLLAELAVSVRDPASDNELAAAWLPPSMYEAYQRFKEIAED